jgi:hypothetical protein
MNTPTWRRISIGLAWFVLVEILLAVSGHVAATFSNSAYVFRGLVTLSSNRDYYFSIYLILIIFMVLLYMTILTVLMFLRIWNGFIQLSGELIQAFIVKNDKANDKESELAQEKAIGVVFGEHITEWRKSIYGKTLNNIVLLFLFDILIGIIFSVVSAFNR